jgi:hypothetical protein
MEDGYRKMIKVLNSKTDKVEPPIFNGTPGYNPELDDVDTVAYPPTPGPANPSAYHVHAKGVADTVAIKNAKYGDSFNQSGDFLRLLYPDGIRPLQYGDMLALIRIFDKAKRVATDKYALGENPFHDMAGYCLLALARQDTKQSGGK